jgi:hypothetical protein
MADRAFETFQGLNQALEGPIKKAVNAVDLCLDANRYELFIS